MIGRSLSDATAKALKSQGKIALARLIENHSGEARRDRRTPLGGASASWFLPLAPTPCTFSAPEVRQ
ncbi:hypothetical protein GCM10017056_00770 [Seohaeicola zhoushanensis]|uniref:Uncharacterized protein n=1 Tax=Seohaeicola zhoushanensis TaxID=1569283 RepID=A0A8J3GTN6_9RHOB|nr:hypothetical protein GCM10017056_00770 [Seohaeicola zhoushanensis]